MSVEIDDLEPTMPASSNSSSSIEVTDETRRARNMEWMKANGQEFGGQYIALENGSLVATGRTFREARAASRAAGNPNPFITYFPKPDETLEAGGWQGNVAELLKLLQSPEFANRRSYSPEEIEARIQENRDSWG